jgi:O-antigen/teichoic acid export membrane protein
MNIIYKELKILFSAKILSLLIAILSQILLTWKLGTADFGSYAFCYIFFSLLSIFFVNGYSFAITYFLSSRYITLSESFIYVFIFGSVSSLFAIFIGFLLLKNQINFFYKFGYSELYISLLIIPFIFLSNTFAQLFSSIQNFKLYRYLILIQSLLQFLFLILFVFIFKMGVKGALLSLIFASLFVICVEIFQFKKEYTFKFVVIKKKIVLKILKYYLSYYLGYVSNSVNHYLGTFMVSLFLNKESVGIYSLANQLISRSIIIPDTIYTMIFPKVSLSKNGNAKLIAQTSRYLVLISFFFMVLIYFLSEPFINLFFSSEFSGAIILIKILTIGFFVRFISKIFVPYYLGVNLPSVPAIISFFGLLVNFFAIILLIPEYGLIGAVIASVLGYVLSSFLISILFIKKSKLKFKDCFILNKNDLLILKKILLS